MVLVEAAASIWVETRFYQLGLRRTNPDVVSYL